MNTYGYDISKFDKEMQTILKRLFACVDAGKMIIEKKKDNDFELHTLTRNGRICEDFSSGFRTDLPHATIVFRSYDNGTVYRLMKGFAKPIFESTDLNGNVRSLKERTVMNKLKKRIQEIENRPQ